MAALGCCSRSEGQCLVFPSWAPKLRKFITGEDGHCSTRGMEGASPYTFEGGGLAPQTRGKGHTPTHHLHFRSFQAEHGSYPTGALHGFSGVAALGCCSCREGPGWVYPSSAPKLREWCTESQASGSKSFVGFHLGVVREYKFGVPWV